MRQIHVNGKWLSQKLTGTQRYAANMVEAIAASDCVDLVLHLPAGAEAPDWAHGYRIRVRRAPVRGIAFEQVYLPAVTAGGMLLNFAGPAPLLKRRQLVTMHDATPFRYPQTFRPTFVAFYYGMYFLLSRTARQLVTVSEFSARELADVLRVPAERFIVAGCAADSLTGVEPARPELDVAAGGHYLVVGTQAVHKNLVAPITAVAATGRDVVVVGLAGDQQVFSSAGSLAGHAVVPGRLTDAELVWLYQNSRALIFPSKYEGFGLPPLEAQAMGCPVVCSDAASLPEVCGEGALYFDPDEPATLLAQLDRLEADADLAAQLRHRGAVNAKRFSWAASADKIVDWLRNA
ncbi:glycosyltransferase family 1 protein [Mycobacterium sp. CPCC 205372]|uniref:Glycosyltransferase family 1 protein n=1 Tax=Mycobacterium hippophais TaxID=3016340 RepID=A0ABT4PRV1_9MYCO|nr:glycosyltransferase family 1 protein [Mycobacterium hippophais]MCZ8379297.1 glycosyltransferase family 1 protein [Mycobacterium hippophais]